MSGCPGRIGSAIERLTRSGRRTGRSTGPGKRWGRRSGARLLFETLDQVRPRRNGRSSSRLTG